MDKKQRMKKRAREHAEKHGMSYQAALQQLGAEESSIKDGRTADPEELGRWVVDTLREWEQFSIDEKVALEPSPRVAELSKYVKTQVIDGPVSNAFLVDLVNAFEGEWPEALFVLPPHFKDIMKSVTGEHVRWSGSRLSLWGIPVYQTPGLPFNVMAAVTQDRRIAFAGVYGSHRTPKDAGDPSPQIPGPGTHTLPDPPEKPVPQQPVPEPDQDAHGYIMYVLNDLRSLVEHASPSDIALTSRFDCIETALDRINDESADRAIAAEKRLLEAAARTDKLVTMIAQHEIVATWHGASVWADEDGDPTDVPEHWQIAYPDDKWRTRTNKLVEKLEQHGIVATWHEGFVQEDEEGGRGCPDHWQVAYPDDELRRR